MIGPLMLGAIFLIALVIAIIEMRRAPEGWDCQLCGAQVYGLNACPWCGARKPGEWREDWERAREMGDLLKAEEREYREDK